MENLYPSNPEKLLKDGSYTAPLYLTGSPQNYRLNLNSGILNHEGTKQLTKPGQGFKIAPLALRMFHGEAFGSAAKDWVEVFFLNSANHVSVLSFHGLSVANLKEASKEIFYSQSDFCSSIMQVVLKEKVKQTKEGNRKYYMAFFDFSEMTETQKDVLSEARRFISKKQYHIYRDSTSNFQTLYEENYSNGLFETAQEIEDNEKRQQRLLTEEFKLKVAS